MITNEQLDEWEGKGPRGECGKWPGVAGNPIENQQIRDLITEVRRLKLIEVISAEQKRGLRKSWDREAELLDLLKRADEMLEDCRDCIDVHCTESWTCRCPSKEETKQLRSEIAEALK